MSTIELEIARIAVLETKVETIKEDIVEIKNDIKIVHTRVDNTADELKAQLDKMYDASCAQHSQLAQEIKALKQFKSQWTYLIIGGVAVLGWVSGHFEFFQKLLGN